MLVEPARSPYDWHFFLLGFSVRVTWLFWLISAAWGYDWAQSLDELYDRLQLETPGMAAILAIWIGVSFISILIHELGHALAMRWYGISSYIVLYHFGGLAIPDGAGSWRRPARFRHVDQIIISAAGPAFQLAFGILVAAIAIACGFSIGSTGGYLDGWVPRGEWPENASLMAVIDATVFTSIFWALLNLLPVLPLDGGQIAQSLIGLHQRSNGLREATILSIVVSLLIVFYGFSQQHSILAMNFLVLAVMNIHALQNRDPFF